jgi:uncharacterized protein (TIGR02118 family)
MYANNDGVRFDHGYCGDKHMPMLQAKLGAPCKSYTVDKALAGGAPGAPALYVASCPMYFDPVEAFQGAFGPNAKEIMADIPNDTGQPPVMQIGDVVVG